MDSLVYILSALVLNTYMCGYVRACVGVVGGIYVLFTTLTYRSTTCYDLVHEEHSPRGILTPQPKSQLTQ